MTIHPTPTAGRLAMLFACCAFNGCAVGQTDDEPRTVDVIVYGDTLITMDETLGDIQDGAIAVNDGVIVAVGPATDIDQAYVAATKIEGAERAVMPGLVNGHTHAAMTLLRGVADDMALIEWLETFIFPVEVAVVDEAFIRTGMRLACYEMIRGGITTFVDMYFFPDVVAEETVACGLRGIVVPSVIDQQSPDATSGVESLAQAEAFVERWQGQHPRIIPAIGAHSVYTISRGQLVEIQKAAERTGAPVSIHVSESLFEIQTINEQYGKTPVELLDELGFLDLQIIAAHVVHPSEDDIELLAERGVGVIHNPTSNMKLASGVSPVANMLSQGVRVGIGTDGAASNNDLDLWEEIRLASLLAKTDTMDPTALPARQALELATSRGAEAAGLADQIGRLAPGLRADLIQVDLSALDASPRYDVVSHLVYVTDADDVVTTMVEGELLMRDRRVLTVNESALRGAVQEWRDRIVETTAPAQ